MKNTPQGSSNRFKKWVINISILFCMILVAEGKLSASDEDLRFEEAIRSIRSQNISCFISHAWGSEDENKFTDRLNKHLKTANIRTYYDRDLPTGSNLVRFMSNIDKADYVISVYTPTYKERAEGEENSGVAREWGAIYDILSSRKFIPILYTGDHRNSVPVLARSILYRSFTDDTKYYENIFDILLHMLPSQGDEIRSLNVSFSQNKTQIMSRSAGRIEPPTSQMEKMLIIPEKEASRSSSSKPIATTKAEQKPSSSAPESKQSSIVRTELTTELFSISLSKSSSKTPEGKTIDLSSSSTEIEKRSIERPISTPIPEIAHGHEDEYRRFFGGFLIYKQGQPGEIRLPISALANPLDGKFNLSKCDDVKQYLTISTGYRKTNKNIGKLEVWIALKFVVEKALKEKSSGIFGFMGKESSAEHLRKIMSDWSSPIGLFMAEGCNRVDWYDYLTGQSFDEISNGENLRIKYQQSTYSNRKTSAMSLMSPSFDCHAAGAALYLFHFQF